MEAIVKSTRLLLEKAKVDKNDITCCGISGHSLGAVPVGRDGTLLRSLRPFGPTDARQSRLRTYLKITAKKNGI